VTLWEFIGFSLVINVVVCTVLWLVSVVKRNVTVADPFWGLGFCVLSAALFLVAPGNLGRSVLVLLMTWLWGLRYALHLYWRQWGHSEETTYYPYKQWRREAGNHFWWLSAVRVFLPQALGTTLVGLPIIVAMHRTVPNHLTFLDLTGVSVWLVGVVVEGVADYQLAVFKHDPANRGKVLSKGLWAYSRHPNYFGDSLVWWGIWLVAFSTPASLPTIVSPAMMTFLLMRVSGVTMVEARSVVASKPEYTEYSKHTSAFFPRWPRRG